MPKEQTMLDLLKNNLSSRLSFSQGDVVLGRIVSLTDKYALIDIGAKSEGVLPISEFKEENLKVGEELWVYVSIPEDKEGQIRLSLKKAQVSKAWEKLAESLEKNLNMEAAVTGHNKGGLVVDVLGLSGFIPFSQLENAPDPAWERPQMQSFLDKLRGLTLTTKVLELNESDNRVILSERKFQEEKALSAKKEILFNLKVGEELEVEVKSILPYGLKVNVSGAEGLIEPQELAWEKAEGQLSNFENGQKLKAKIIELNIPESRLRLSIKQTQADPWEDLSQKVKNGKIVESDVYKITSFGILVKVNGLDGLLPLSEFPDNLDIKVGQKINVKITAVDKEKRRLDLKLA